MMTKDYDLIRKCLFRIEEKLNWGSSDTWHNDVFIELSDQILDETSILLSPTTLKRVWGKVNYNSNPSINTLNTLAQFAGYQNWRDFKNKSEQIPIAVKRPKKSNSKLKVFGVTLLLAGLVASALIAMRTKDGNKIRPDFTKVSFSSQPVTSGLPNSVVFDFDLQGIVSDSIYIQQYWDETKTIKISTEQSQATGQYYLPGYFRAKLLVDGVIGKEHDLFIKSDGWLGTIDYDPIPKYFEESLILKNDLSLPEPGLKEIENSEKPLISTFHLVDDLGEISGDNFSLETSFRNIYNDKWAVCSTTRLVVLGSKGAMIIPFSIPGCVSEIGVMLNDVYLSGKENDLSIFGTELTNFQKFVVQVENMKTTISIDGKTIFQGTYTETLGKLVGIRYRFLGAGEVKYLKIRDLESDSLILNEDFYGRVN